MPTVLDRLIRICVTILVVMGAAFALYTGATGPFEAPVQTGFFTMVMLPMVFLLAPSKLIKHETVEAVSNLTLAALAALVMAYNLVNFERLYSEPFIGTLDISVGILGLVLILEAVRRTVGLAIT